MYEYRGVTWHTWHHCVKAVPPALTQSSSLSNSPISIHGITALSFTKAHNICSESSLFLPVSSHLLSIFHTRCLPGMLLLLHKPRHFSRIIPQPLYKCPFWSSCFHSNLLGSEVLACSSSSLIFITQFYCLRSSTPRPSLSDLPSANS